MRSPSPIVQRDAPLGDGTEGARQSWWPARNQNGSGSVPMLPVAERVVQSIVAAPVMSPAPVVIGSRCPATPVDSDR